MNALNTIDTSTLCKVTNSTGTDLFVGMLIADIETQSEGSILNTDRSFELLPVGKSGNVIHSGEQDTVTLNRSFRAEDGTMESEIVYQLIICKTDWFSPIASLSLTQQWDDDDGPNFYKEQTVLADAVTAQQQSVNFFQTISAYPDSRLAKDYVDSMSGVLKTSGNGDDAADAAFSSMEAAVAAFFAGTKNYQLVTLASIKMVELYYDIFPFAWAQYKNAFSYYLYGSDGTKTTFKGIVSFNKTGSPDIARLNCGYTILFTPSANPEDTSKTGVKTSDAVPMFFHKGIFVENAKADIPQIALKGLFQLKRNFTNVSTDTMIIPVLSGSINGVVVIGFDETQATKPDDSTMDWLRSLFAPKTAEGIFNAFNQIMGALMMLHFVGGLILGAGQWLRQKIGNKKTVKLEELQEKLRSLEIEGRQARAEMYRKLNPENESSFPGDSAEAVQKASLAGDILQGQVGKVRLNEKIRELNSQLSEMQSFIQNDDLLSQKLADAGDDLFNTAESLSKVSPEKLKALLAEEVRPQLKSIVDNITTLSGEVSRTVSKDMKANAEQSEQTIQQVQSEIEDQSKSSEDQRSEETNIDLEVSGEPLP